MTFSFGKVAVAGIALAALAYGMKELRGPNGYNQLLQRREQVRELEKENRDLRQDIDRLEKRVDKLKHNPTVQELEVRRRLGLVKPGETVYVLEKPASTSK